MKKLFLYTFLSSHFLLTDLYGIHISEENARAIALKVWKNECAGTIQGLTSWNAGENFASLGIGHFIWYPPESNKRFQESFPELLSFLENRGVVLPAWLKKCTACPWNSREAFHAEINSSQMESLRNFLFETKDLQMVYIIQRLEKTLPSLTKDLPEKEKMDIAHTFLALEKTSNGLYALIDYLNFKGSGTSNSESYQGKRWGLLQVLQGIPPSSTHVIADFVASAKKVLTDRVKNSPPERNEQRWLKGWLNRVDTYLLE